MVDTWGVKEFTAIMGKALVSQEDNSSLDEESLKSNLRFTTLSCKGQLFCI